MFSIRRKIKISTGLINTLAGFIKIQPEFYISSDSKVFVPLGLNNSPTRPMQFNIRACAVFVRVTGIVTLHPSMYPLIHQRSVLSAVETGFA